MGLPLKKNVMIGLPDFSKVLLSMLKNIPKVYTREKQLENYSTMLELYKKNFKILCS